MNKIHHWPLVKCESIFELNGVSLHACLPTCLPAKRLAQWEVISHQLSFLFGLVRFVSKNSQCTDLETQKLGVERMRCVLEKDTLLSELLFRRRCEWVLVNC